MGLLDSGATSTILGGPGWKQLEPYVVLKKTDEIKCTVANGDKCEIKGTVTCPIQLRDRLKVIEVLVIPTLPHILILGMDFWRKMEIIPDMFSREWTFKSSSSAPKHEVAALTSIEHMTKDQKKELETLVDTQFEIMGNNLGCTNMVQHVIKTTHPPIRQRHYPLSKPVQEAVNAEVDEMLKSGVIEPSKSPWCSPILLLKKPDGRYRFVVDFRQLNKVTERDAYPLPFVSATLDKLRNARFLSTLDIKSAYWQIPLSEESKPLTAFVIPNKGLFQFRRMPMGLHNAPATWQRFIDQLFVDMDYKVLIYLDDVIVCSNNFEEHITVLREVFNRLTKAGLTLNREKCHFCKSELRYLGYIVGANGLMVDPMKVEAILNIPTPQKVGDVRRIIGLSSWYRRFISNFSDLTAPLCNLLRKNVRFEWTAECDAAFNALKESLISAPILTCPDFEKPFIVQTDASDFGLGAILSQQTDEGEKVICYLSRSLTRLERSYSVTQKECLAVLFAIEKLKPYLLGTKFTVVTDHYSLKWLNNIKDPVGRIARWAVRMQQYDFDVVHRKGKDHAGPDALSRAVPRIDEMRSDVNSSSVGDTNEDKWYQRMCHHVVEKPNNFPSWRIEKGILFKKTKISYPNLQDPTDGWLEVVPKDARNKIISENHDPPTCGHLGVFKTTSRITSKYYWPKLRQDVAKFIRNCRVCLSVKPEQKPPAGQMLSVAPTLDRPWQTLSIDLMGPLPRTSSGYSYILSVLDVFSKFLLLFPLRQATASKISDILENQVILLFGAPQKVVMDNGVQFRSKQVCGVFEKYKIKPNFISNYHPQSNPVERSHRVVKTLLTAYVHENHRNWEKFLQPVAWAIRTARHEVTQLPPSFILFGRSIQLSGQPHPLSQVLDDHNQGVQTGPEALQKLYKEVALRLKKAYEQSRIRYNLRHRDEKFKIGQKVWRRNHILSDAFKGVSAKLAPKFEGPFEIAKTPSPYSYELIDAQTRRTLGVWHAKDLKSHPPDAE